MYPLLEETIYVSLLFLGPGARIAEKIPPTNGTAPLTTCNAPRAAFPVVLSSGSFVESYGVGSVMNVGTPRCTWLHSCARAVTVDNCIYDS